MKLLLLSLLLITVATLPAQTKSPEERVKAALPEVIKAMKIPGLSFAIVKDGKLAASGAFGKANLTYDVPAKTSTRFLLASISKTFTAVGIMMLVEQGKIKLEDKIGIYLADTPPAWSDITVRHLLQHTAGLKDRFEEKEMVKWRLLYPLADMYASAKATPLDYKPGERFQYSDQGYFLLGMIIEKVSGGTYREFLRKNIFEPSGMKSSTTILLDEITPDLAQGYSIAKGQWINNNRRTDYGMTSHFGIVSTAEDLAAFSIALDAEKLVKSSTLESMWDPGMLSNGDASQVGTWSYGDGWFVKKFNGVRVAQHGGSTGTAFYKLPDQKLTVVVLTNLEQIAGGNATAIAETIAKTYEPALQWASIKPGAKPAGSDEFEAEIKRVASGSIQESLYDPDYAKLLKPIIPAQKPFFDGIGDVKSIDFLFKSRIGAARQLAYRAVFRDMTLYVTFGLNKSGKIVTLLMEGEELPD